MAVKKKAVKKAPVKKVAAKKAPVKKVAKKAPVKKVAVKKAPVKKVAVKKAPVKKVAVKKAPVKKSAVKKPAQKRSIQIDDLLASLEIESSLTPATTTKVASIDASFAAHQARRNSQIKRNRLRLAALAIFAILISILAVNASSQKKSATPTATPSATAKPTPTKKSVVKATKKTVAKKKATAKATKKPVVKATKKAVAKKAPKIGKTSVSARMTADGATVLWTAPATTTGLAGYKIEVAVDGSSYTLLSTVSSDTTSIDLTKSDDNGVTMVRISAMFSNGTLAALGEFGLPGKY